ncbi:MAG: 2-hydroxyacid dehydrogenase [Rhizobiaceae bacterium]
MNPAAKEGRVLVSITDWDVEAWLEAFRTTAPEREFVTEPDGSDDPSIKYAVVWKQPSGLMSSLPNLELVFSLGAGVDHVLTDPSLPDAPIVRIVSPDLTMRMSEYVVWQVLDHFRKGAAYRLQQQEKVWKELSQPAASAMTIGIVGLGVLGTDSARILRSLGFKICGWSRTQKSVDGVICYSGDDGLESLLAQGDIVVVLLPLTPQTKGMINQEFLGAMKRKTPIGGPVLINAGRGGLQIEADILEALNSGKLMAASLDVFETEPLDANSALWTHPSVMITPHAAACSDPATLAVEVVRQMDDFEKGIVPTGLVNRDAGY